jgi:hypothetical protein
MLIRLSHPGLGSFRLRPGGRDAGTARESHPLTKRPSMAARQVL